jgi:fructose 1,6-bisphosphatase
MDGPILVVDTSEINEGRLGELKAAMAELVAFVEQNEERPLLYMVYVDSAGRNVTVIQLHPDSASMEQHMKVAGSKFRHFADLLTLRTMDIFGTPSEQLLDQLRAKVRLLGQATLELHDLHAGFARLGYTQRTTVAGGS